MPQLSLSINERDYVISCGAGEEAKLEKIASFLNEKINRLDPQTKKSSDIHLILIAALMAASDVLELNEQLQSLRREIVQVQKRAQQKSQANALRDSHLHQEKIVTRFAHFAQRINVMADRARQPQK